MVLLGTCSYTADIMLDLLDSFCAEKGGTKDGRMIRDSRDTI